MIRWFSNLFLPSAKGTGIVKEKLKRLSKLQYSIWQNPISSLKIMESFVKTWKMLCYKISMLCKRQNEAMYHYNQMKKRHRKNE